MKAALARHALRLAEADRKLRHGCLKTKEISPMSKLLCATTLAIATLAMVPVLVEAQPAPADSCIVVSVTAGGLTRVIAGDRAQRRLQRYMWERNLATVPFGPVTTTCMGWGVVGARPVCKSSTTVCTSYPLEAAVPVK
jgi:hypothetical protein